MPYISVLNYDCSLVIILNEYDCLAVFGMRDCAIIELFMPIDA